MQTSTHVHRASYALPAGTPALQDPPFRRWLLLGAATVIAIAAAVVGYLAANLTP